MRIPEDIVLRLNELPIEGVAERLGIVVNRHKAICFMHDDHNPSLSFNQSNNLFFCFVCNKGGGPIQLAMNHQGWSFQEACQWLAREFNIPIPDDIETDFTYKRPFRKMHMLKRDDVSTRFDVELFSWLIDNAQLSELSQKFLFEERHLSKEIIKRLRIKSVTNPKKVVQALIARFGEERCISSGLVRQGKFGTYFYFYTPCLLLPYYEQDGILIGVQSRYLGNKRDVPRFQFLSSQKTRLYNLPILNNLERGDRLLITEGITDCLAALSMGLNAVAIPSATVQPLEDLVLLKNFDLHMFPDQDEAGMRAFMELRRFFVNNGAMVKMEKLPDGVKDYSEYFVLTQVSNGNE